MKSWHEYDVGVVVKATQRDGGENKQKALTLLSSPIFQQNFESLEQHSHYNLHP